MFQHGVVSNLRKNRGMTENIHENVQLDHSHHILSREKYPLCFLAHDIDVPMNVGSLFRIADAFAVEKVYLSGSSLVPPNSKIKKTSRSTEKYVPFSYEQYPLDLIYNLKNAGYKIISLEITTLSIDIKNIELAPSEKVCLILGSENAGLSQDFLDISDITVHIPMLGQNSSMNVAVACSIAAFEITRRYQQG